MTYSLDQIIEPGESVVERATRSGLREGWRCASIIFICLLGISSIPLIGEFHGLWYLNSEIYLIGFGFSLATVPIFMVLERTHGTYSAAAVLTTRRVIAGTGMDTSKVDELRLVDVKRVRLVPAVFGSDRTIVSGRRGESFMLKQPCGGGQLAAAIADASGLPSPRSPGSLMRWVFKTFIGICLLIFLISAFGDLPTVIFGV